MEIVSWAPGDNGRPTRAMRPEYTTFDTNQAAAAGVPPRAVNGAYNTAPVQTQSTVSTTSRSTTVMDLNAQWAAASKGGQRK